MYMYIYIISFSQQAVSAAVKRFFLFFCLVVCLLNSHHTQTRTCTCSASSWRGS